MAMRDVAGPEYERAPYELLMLCLSVFVLVALGAEMVFPLDASSRAILQVADTVICFAFLADFLHSVWVAPNRRRYLATWGWLDLLSSIPTLSVARWGRVARVVRVIRLLRGARSTRTIAAFVLKRRAHAAFAAVALMCVLLVVFGSIAILVLEGSEPGANIRTAGDAMWWSYATVTTVGYGDRFPVTPEGRLVAAILMAAGVGLFGTLTGFLASWFIAPGEQEERNELKTVLDEVRSLRRAVEQLQSERTA